MKRILIVDNDKLNVDKLADWLSNQDYRISKMYSHANLLDVIYNFIPSILIMGIHLHGIDGRYLCSLLKSMDHTKHIEIIMVSQNPNQYQVDDEEWCADAFLYEPYGQEDILKLIAKFEAKEMGTPTQ